MDSLQDDHAAFRQRDVFVRIEGLVLHEIETAARNRLATHERVDVGGETPDVHAFDVLVVELAVLVPRIERVADEIVVRREVEGGGTPVHQQLRADALRRRRLASGGSAGHQHQPHAALFADFVRNPRQGLDLLRLGDANHLVDGPVRNMRIQLF